MTPGQFQLMTREEPGEPGPGEALVRIKQVGVCGTDLHAFRGNQPFFTYPRVLGHELGVEVLAVGENQAGLSAGTRCAVEPYFHCGHCPACLRGKPNCCLHMQVFEDDIAVHAAIARTLGPYKISLHSGSDKYSIYKAAARQTAGLVHLKTAGTSYLEALRTVAERDSDLMREIYAFARERYLEDRASYHIFAELDRAPAIASLFPEKLPALLEHFDARKILHVTFGSVLTARASTGQWRFYGRLMKVLQMHEDVYTSHVHMHFLQHLQPLTRA